MKAMAIYLDYAGFKGLTTIPSKFVDEVEDEEPGWVDNQVDLVSRWVDARLRKRYDTPFAAHTETPPTPRIIQEWVMLIATERIWRKRGIDPNDLQYVQYAEEARIAKDEVLEAANSETGLFDLPTQVNADGTEINRGDPEVYSEQSPYVWSDNQADVGRCEDKNGGGSFG